VTLSHASPLKEIDCILLLGQKQPIRRARDGDAEEVMKVAKVRHSELGVETLGDVLQESRRGGSQDDVVDVEKQVCDTVSILVYKERRARG